MEYVIEMMKVNKLNELKLKYFGEEINQMPKNFTEKNFFCPSGS